MSEVLTVLKEVCRQLVVPIKMAPLGFCSRGGGGGQNSCFCIPGGGKRYMLYNTIYI